jgi:hypothetical protein
MAWHHPGIPNPVHALKIGQVDQENLNHQQFAFVCASASEQSVNGLQDLTRLTFNVQIRIFGNLTCQIHHAVVNGHFREPRAHIKPLNHVDILVL